MREATIPYAPRPLWRDVIHPALDRVRFATLVCHRRFGKTVGVINHCVKKAVTCKLPAPRYAYFAPFRTQAKLIAWEYLKFYTGAIPNVKTLEVELSVELPSQHPGRAGAKIFVAGADKPDALRGNYMDGVILDEYGQIRPAFAGEVVRPMIADRSGWMWRLGTPKGKNALYEQYEADRKTPGRFACLYTVDDSGVIPEKELEEMKKDMTPMQIRQELYCDFTASASDILIPIDLAWAAAGRKLRPEDVRLSPRVMGVDVARFGDDRSVIVRRQGLVAFPPKVFEGLDNMLVADALAAEILDFRPHCVFIDAGRGEGVIDRVRQLGFRVVEANFGARAIDGERYINRRSEMWDETRKWLESGGSVLGGGDMAEELSMPTYSFDASNRMVLEKKEKIKERMGKSPDVADALALTFFAPVSGDAGAHDFSIGSGELYGSGDMF
jgi:hypothetical protein